MVKANSRKRQNFTDKQKADIFVRDKATCCFSGKCLWVLGHGASPTWEYDWVDHIKPTKKGGGATLDNGVCASSSYNWKKRDNSHDTLYLFEEGWPTEFYFETYEVITPERADHLKQFSNLHYSDWYFNRALAHVNIGLEVMWGIEEGEEYARKPDYWARAGIKKLNKWHAIVEKEQAPSMEKRKIVSVKKLEADQLIMYELRKAETEMHLEKAMKQLLPFYKDNHNAIYGVTQLENTMDAKKFINRLGNLKRLSKRIEGKAKTNARRLFNIT